MGEEKGYFRKYIGREAEVYLSDEVEGRILTVIGSKAFLSCKTVERLVLPGSVEQVEDVDDQKQGYILKRRSDKVELVFQRLVCGEEPREQFQQYLHSMLVEHAEHVWKLFIENPRYGRSVEYFKIWQQSGGLEHSTAQKLLAELPWEEPEIRGYLMELLQSGSVDYFAQLEL